MDSIYHCQYVDGTYGEVIAADVEDADDQMARSDVEMNHGAVKGRAPRGASVVISNFSSERNI